MNLGTPEDRADTVLIVEDDPEIAGILAVNIQDLGLQTERAADGLSGLEKARSGGYALIILDLMLPRLDGISLCTRLRETDPLTPVLILTARDGEIDRVLGLELGADDYMTKPFSVRELTARVKALLRRARASAQTSPEDPGEPFRIGELSVDFGKRKVLRGDRELELTVKEFELLALFIRNPGRAYDRAELLELVWGYRFEGYEHTVNTHINRLRGKIEEDPARPRYLRTVWGVGYRFAEPEEFAPCP